MTATPPGGVGVATGVARVAAAAVLITVLTVVARIAGFGRIFVFLHTVGDTDLGDAYNAANTIPNIVFELVAGGALASLVVPLLAGAVAAGQHATVSATTSALLTWVLSLLIPLAVLVAVAAGPIAGLLHGLGPDERAAVADMLRLFAPQLPLYGVGIVFTGVLQAHHRFAWPVLAPLLSSVTVLGAYLAYAVVDGPRTGLPGLSPGGQLILAIGTTLGVVVLALCLIIPVRRLKLRLRPTYRFPGDEGRRAVRLGWAGGVTVGAQQIMVAVIIVLTASPRTAGTLTQFIAAQTIFLLPWAVLAVPLATAVYPRLSAAATHGDAPGYATALAGTARSVMLLACLGAAALAALATPAAAVINAPLAAPGIVGFAPGLLGYALFALLSRALYARGATVAAATATAGGWGIGALAAVAMSAAFRTDQQVLALGLANAVAMSVIGVLLILAVRRHAGAHALAGLGRASMVGIVAAVVAGLAGWAVVRASGTLFGATPAAPASILQGMLGGVVVVVVFTVVAYPLDRHDARPLVTALGRRLARRTPTLADPQPVGAGTGPGSTAGSGPASTAGSGPASTAGSGPASTDRKETP